MCELGRRLGSQRGISVCIFNHESRAGCGDQEECWRRSSPTLPFHEDEIQPTSDFKIKHLASLRQRTEFKSRILSVPLSFYFLFIYLFYYYTMYAKYYKSRGRKSKVWHLILRFHYVWENWTVEFVTYEAGKDLQRSPNLRCLKTWFNAKTSESPKVPWNYSKVLFLWAIFWRGGLHQILNEVYHPLKVKNY